MFEKDFIVSAHDNSEKNWLELSYNLDIIPTSKQLNQLMILGNLYHGILNDLHIKTKTHL